MSENKEQVFHVVSEIWCDIVERAKMLDYGTAKVVMEKIKNNHHGLKRYHNLPVNRQVNIIGPTSTSEEMFKAYVEYTRDEQGYHIESFAQKLYELAYIDALMDLVPKEVYDHLDQKYGD